MGFRQTRDRIESRIRDAMRSVGLDLHRFHPSDDPWSRLAHAAAAREVATLLDVGANVGQFAAKIRQAGYRGRIVSFEPLAACHGTLVRRASGDPAWIVAPRAALGAAAGTTTINVSSNPAASSLLAGLRRLYDAAPQAGVVDRESVPVTTLDAYLDEVAGSLHGPYCLKLDVQGYESFILDGARRHLQEIAVILLEMQLAPLYEGGSTFAVVCARLIGEGYRCIAMSPGFIDRTTFEVLEIDGLFVRG